MCADDGTARPGRRSSARVAAASLTTNKPASLQVILSVAVVAVPIALVQPLLVLTLELVVEDDVIDARAALLQALCFAFEGDRPGRRVPVPVRV